MKPIRPVTVIAAALALAASAARADGLPVVANGRAVAEIVHDFRAPAPEQHAAAEIQRWIGEITGAFVPVHTPRETNAAPVKIFVGAAFARPLFPKDFARIRKTDGFAVRTAAGGGETRIYVFGGLPRGTLHGAYAFLERNSDLIWARPDPKIGTVFGRSPDFSVSDADFIDVPVTATRSWQWTFHTPTHESEWESRNRMNRMGTGDPKFGALWTSGGFGHGIQRWIDPKTYFEAHPDWYPADKQGRRHVHTGQICFLAYDMIPTYVSNVCARIAAEHPGKNPQQVGIDFFNLSTADNWDVCHCPKCEAPFRCENGVVVDSTNEVFRSAQHYTFLNKVARELRKRYPKATVGTYAYEFTLLPPPFPLEPNVMVEYCPYGLNEKAPVTDDSSNSFWHRCWDEWGRFSRNTFCRYYLGWANEFPRQIESAIQSNALHNLTLKYPIRHFSAEHPVDSESKPCPNSVATWDSSAISAWVISRLWWNPAQDVDQLRETFCRRAFREAWIPMKKFYDTIRNSVYSDRLPSLYTSSDPVPYALNYVVKPGLAEPLRTLLTNALAQTEHPVSKELIARQLRRFDTWIEKAGKINSALAMDVPFRAETDLETSFDAAFWNDVAGTGDLIVADEGARHGQQAKFRTTAKAVHDRENLFLRFDCCASDMTTLKGNRPEGDAVERVPRGDIVEFYVGDGATGVYYQFITDVGNGGEMKDDVTYDAKVFDNTWTCGWSRKTKRYPDRWVVIAKIPMTAVGVNAVQSGKVLFQAIRGKYYDTGKTGRNGRPVVAREMSSWGGGWVHQPQTFGQLRLELAR